MDSNDEQRLEPGPAERVVRPDKPKTTHHVVGPTEAVMAVEQPPTRWSGTEIDMGVRSRSGHRRPRDVDR